MTPTAKFVRHALFLPVAAAEDRERRLVEEQRTADSTQRTVRTMFTRFFERAADIHNLADVVVEQVDSAKEGCEK